mgnify:FL=1
MSRASRASLVAAGVKALHVLLVQIIQRPVQFSKDADLHLALKSQGSLAKLERSIASEKDEPLITYPMSLNSLKTHANENLVGGFKALNDLRLKALEALEFAEKRQQHANKRSKSGLTRKVEQLEQELEMQRQTNVILLRALSESMTQLTNIRDAADDKIRAKRTHDAPHTLRAILGMGMPPFNQVDNYSEAHAPIADVANISDYRKG